MALLGVGEETRRIRRDRRRDVVVTLFDLNTAGTGGATRGVGNNISNTGPAIDVGYDSIVPIVIVRAIATLADSHSLDERVPLVVVD